MKFIRHKQHNYKPNKIKSNMCIAILNTKGATLKRELLKNCWENNGDGAGLLYIDNQKRMGTFKELKRFDVFYAEYSRVKKSFGKRNILIHFRISTHGRVNEINCHPFLVNEDLGFIHNGMIYDVPNSTEYSDTYMFNEIVLKNFTDGFEQNETILSMLEGFINSSKLVFLNSNNEYSIVNEVAGHWADGCWFSNSSYKQVNNYVDYGGVKKYKGSGWGNSWGSSSNYGTGYKMGYTPGNIYGQSWESSAPSKPIDEAPLCFECGMSLFDDEEIAYEQCSFCLTEMTDRLKAYDVDDTDKVQSETCECCMAGVGEYNDNWKAVMCVACEEEIPF